MKNKGISTAIVIVIVIVVAVAAAAGGYLVLSGGGGGESGGGGTNGGGTNGGGNGNGGTNGGGTNGLPTTVTSIDVTWSGYEAGEFTGGARLRGRNMDTDNPDWRIEAVEEDHIFIYNSAEEAAYYTGPNEETWTKLTGPYIDQYAQAWESWVTTAEGWALNYGEVGETSVTVGEDTVTISINMVNESLSDDIFTPPEDAVVEEIS